MIENPKVSIIIPLYNGANYVEQAIKSAISQTYKNIEIIVVNDGSRDDGEGESIVMKYKNSVSYIKKENGGCASALNEGIRYAKGDFISWLSHDDLYYPEKIEYQISLYKKKGLDYNKTIISNYADLIDSHGNKMFHPVQRKTGLLNNKKAFRYLLFNKCFNGCGLLIPKKLFSNISFFDETLRFVLDWNLWLKFALCESSVYLDSKILVSNRVHSAQVTVKQKELHSKETEVTINELFHLAKNNEDTFYMKQLFYFTYSTRRGNWVQIKEICNNRSIKFNKFTQLYLRIRMQGKNMLKILYHKVRKILFG